MTNKTIQTYLQALGYYCGLIDGVKGPLQTRAVKEFQKDNKLEADGVVGSKTRPKLKKAYQNRDKKQLSRHFEKVEFKCGCKGRYCNGYPAAVSPKLLGILEKLRIDYGKPITITSGVRCKKHNNSLPGSSRTSLHLKGKAADIYIPGVSRAEIKKRAYRYGAAYSYYGTPGMGNAVHINI